MRRWAERADASEAARRERRVQMAIGRRLDELAAERGMERQVIAVVLETDDQLRARILADLP